MNNTTAAGRKPALSRIILAALLSPLLLLASCTHNNGDIGPVFGLWQLTQVEGGDVEYTPSVQYTIYWCFQSTTIQMFSVDDHHNNDQRFGNFSMTDDRLNIDFPDTGGYGAPLLGLPRQCSLDVLQLDGSRMTLRYAPADSGETIYYFRKW